MTKVVVNPNLPFFDRTQDMPAPSQMDDQMIEQQFPNVVQQVGVKPYQGTAYPKVNVYEYDDKIGLIAEIPGLKKKQLNIEVEDSVLTISGDKHNVWDDAKAKILRRELKQSSFKRSFELGELLDGDNISASFTDGILSISIPKLEPEKPKKKSVKIS